MNPSTVYPSSLSASLRDEKIIARYTPNHLTSSILMNASPMNYQEIESCVFVSCYEFFWTSEKEGKLLPDDFDTAERKPSPYVKLEKLGHIFGCLVQGGECRAEQDRKTLYEILKNRGDGLYRLFDSLELNRNIYIIYQIVFCESEHNSAECKKRIIEELPWRIRKHDHVRLDALMFANNHSISDEEREFRCGCGFSTLATGVYIKEFDKENCI